MLSEEFKIEQFRKVVKAHHSALETIQILQDQLVLAWEIANWETGARLHLQAEMNKGKHEYVQVMDRTNELECGYYADPNDVLTECLKPRDHKVHKMARIVVDEYVRTHPHPANTSTTGKGASDGNS